MTEKGGPEFDYEICNSRIRPIAEALIAKYDELRQKNNNTNQVQREPSF